MQEEHGKNYWGQLFLQMLFHPIFLVMYGLAWFYLAQLFWYGPAENCLPQLILCGLFFVLYLILFFVRGFTGHVQGGLFARGSFRRPYRIFAAGVLAALTLFFGFHSLQGYREGALARKLENLTNQRVLTPIHTNLFETGLDGLLEDIDQVMELPDELYLGDDLNLLFDSDGTLRSLYTYLYGNVFQVIGRYMKGEAARQLTELFDSYIDLLNYVRILRLKFTYRSGTDFIRSTLFPYGAFRKKLLNEVLAAESKEQIDAALAKTSIGRQIAKTEYNYVDEIPNRVKYKTCRRDIRFSTHPSVVMMSYIFLTQCEIYDIITIVEGIRYQLPPDEIEKLLTVIRFDPV